MRELLLELKELIKAGKSEEAIAEIDEAIAAMPETMSTTGPVEIEPGDPPLPGQGTNGRPPKK